MPPGRSVAVSCGQSQSVAVGCGQSRSVVVSRDQSRSGCGQSSLSRTGEYVLLTAYASSTLHVIHYILWDV